MRRMPRCRLSGHRPRAPYSHALDRAWPPRPVPPSRSNPRATACPFSLTWRSVTFPVGTTVPGTSELAAPTGSIALAWIEVALFLLLIGAWLTAATCTVHGSLLGRLFLPPHRLISGPAG